MLYLKQHIYCGIRLKPFFRRLNVLVHEDLFNLDNIVFSYDYRVLDYTVDLMSQRALI